MGISRCWESNSHSRKLADAQHLLRLGMSVDRRSSRLQNRYGQANSGAVLLLSSAIDCSPCCAICGKHAESTTTAQAAQWSRDRRSKANEQRQAPTMGNGLLSDRLPFEDCGFAVRVGHLVYMRPFIYTAIARLGPNQARKNCTTGI